MSLEAESENKNRHPAPRFLSAAVHLLLTTPLSRPRQRSLARQAWNRFMWSGEREAVDLPRLDPRKAMLGSNDTRFGQSLPAAIRRRVRAHRASHTSVSTFNFPVNPRPHPATRLPWRLSGSSRRRCCSPAPPPLPSSSRQWARSRQTRTTPSCRTRT